MEIFDKKKLILLWTVGLGAGFLSCSDKLDEEPGGKKEIPGTSIVLRTGEVDPDRPLACSLYIFGKSSGEADYSLQKVIAPVVDEETTLDMDLSNDPGYLYRFLFVATPEGQPEIAVCTPEGQSLSDAQAGALWANVRLASKVDSLTLHNYYGITEMSGSAIFQTGHIAGQLSRLTGQWMFYFYKAGPGGVDDPVGVNRANALSVFDRIYQIDVTYSGCPSVVSFGENNALQAVPGQETAFKRTYKPVLSDSLKTAIPQDGLPWDVYQTFAGSVRMSGACFLPVDKQMKVQMVFHYYDTTPVNSSPSPDCFTKKEVTLNIPAESRDPLSILPNHYTVNKVALPCDRVIDIQHQSGLNIQTDWNIKTTN